MKAPSFSTPPPTVDDLLALLLPFGIESPLIETLFEKTALTYSGEGRFYHNLHHIGQVLSAIHWLVNAENFSLTRESQLSLYLAAWFHDVIYDPQRGDNEEKSAEWMTRELSQLGIHEAVIQKSESLILATRSHVASSEDVPSQILLDADLSIFSAPPDIYTQYTRAIRQEYSFVPEEAYRAGRQEVLKRFLARPQIYSTRPAIEWEGLARKNLEREMISLSLP